MSIEKQSRHHLPKQPRRSNANEKLREGGWNEERTFFFYLFVKLLICYSIYDTDFCGRDHVNASAFKLSRNSVS